MRAEGGWGAVFTEFCSIHPKSDEYPFISARIWDEGDVHNLSLMCEIDIRAVITMYVEAGKRAAAAGFDTLPMQLMQPRFNQRTDGYDGSFANRSRFLIELLQPLKQALGDRCAITTRFEIDTLHGPDGVEAHEDGVKLLELFRTEGVLDAVALKIGDYAEWGEDAGPSRFRKSGWMAPFITLGKSLLGPDIPVVGNGRLTSPDGMVRLIREGVLDSIGAARPSICQIMCTQNVTIGEEYRRGWHPEKFRPDPQGLQRTHRRRRPGGQGMRSRPRRAVSMLPRLNEWGRVITYRQTQLSKLKKNVQVHLGVGRMTADGVLDYGADRVVLATGSSWHSDGHFMGVALAELLADRGNNKRMLFEKGVKLYCSHWVDRIEAGRVRLSYL